MLTRGLGECKDWIHDSGSTIGGPLWTRSWSFGFLKKWAIDLMTWASVGFVTTLLHGVGSFILLFVATGGTFFIRVFLVGFVRVYEYSYCVWRHYRFRTSVLDTDLTQFLLVFANYFFILPCIFAFFYLSFSREYLYQGVRNIVSDIASRYRLDVGRVAQSV